jgi:hypothetical protein
LVAALWQRMQCRSNIGTMSRLKSTGDAAHAAAGAATSANAAAAHRSRKLDNAPSILAR